MVGHALAKTWIGFAVARFGLAVGQSGNNPAAVKAVAEWFPKRDRALAIGIFNGQLPLPNLWPIRFGIFSFSGVLNSYMRNSG